MDSEMRNSLFTLLREVNDAGVMKDSQLRDCIDELEEQILTTRAEPAGDDTVERVHKAICGALVMMGYSPIEFVVDGTMTAMARAALQAAAVEPAADAVHAVHEALVNSAPGWIIDREDGELLDMARAALQAAAKGASNV